MSSRSSKTESPFDPSDTGPAREHVLVGHVRRPHGVRGEVEVEVFSDVPGRFAPGSELLATGPEGARRRLTVASSRGEGARILVHFEGIGDRDEAEELKGLELQVPVADVPPLPEGDYYHFQLLGCRCRDRHLGDLGEVVELVEDGGGLLLIAADGDRRVPIPFVASFLREIDVEARRIELDLPPGLVEICGSTS